MNKNIMVYVGGFVTFLIILSFLASLYPTVNDEGRKLGDYGVFIINETFTAYNSSSTGNVEGLSFTPYVSGSAYILNASNYAYIGTNNFTINANTGAITLSNGATQALNMNNTAMLISYNYTKTSGTIFNTGFGSSGVVYVVFAAVVLIGAIAILLKKKSR
jgi:hypothetical protein